MAEGQGKDREFSGKAVIVTGAASGLGRATAVAFAHAGADLLLTDVNAAGIEETAATCCEAGAKAEVLAVNLTDVGAIPQVVERAVGAYGRLDALMNVAGAFRFTPLDRLTAEDFDLIMAVNLRAPLFLTKAAMPHLIASEGAVVNVASASAFLGHSYLGPYAASKAALVSLTKSLAMEFAHSPVRINALAPGAVATPMALEPHMPEGLDFSLIMRFAGLRGMSQPEEITELLLFLASPRAKAVHGACFIADRGITAG